MKYKHAHQSERIIRRRSPTTREPPPESVPSPARSPAPPPAFARGTTRGNTRSTASSCSIACPYARSVLQSCPPLLRQLNRHVRWALFTILPGSRSKASPETAEQWLLNLEPVLSPDLPLRSFTVDMTASTAAGQLAEATRLSALAQQLVSEKLAATRDLTRVYAERSAEHAVVGDGDEREGGASAAAGRAGVGEIQERHALKAQLEGAAVQLASDIEQWATERAAIDDVLRQAAESAAEERAMLRERIAAAHKARAVSAQAWRADREHLESERASCEAAIEGELEALRVPRHRRKKSLICVVQNGHKNGQDLLARLSAAREDVWRAASGAGVGTENEADCLSSGGNQTLREAERMRSQLTALNAELKIVHDRAEAERQQLAASLAAEKEAAETEKANLEAELLTARHKAATAQDQVACERNRTEKAIAEVREAAAERRTAVQVELSRLQREVEETLHIGGIEQRQQALAVQVAVRLRDQKLKTPSTSCDSGRDTLSILLDDLNSSAIKVMEASAQWQAKRQRLEAD